MKNELKLYGKKNYRRINKIKISHEVPLSLLKKSRDFNDYDYCLVPLLDKYPQYYDFYKESINLRRTVLLDNGVFELGKAYSFGKFAEWIEKLQPQEYIIPDVFGNYKQTIDNCKNWYHDYGSIKGKKIGVVQGQTYSELRSCYEVMNTLCDKIAFNHGISYYVNSFPNSNVQVSYMLGRIDLIYRFLDQNIINMSKPHHLLGCSLPQEFIYYGDLDWIESVDTSNPIIHGIKEIMYNSWGLLNKEEDKIIDLMEIDTDYRSRCIIDYNINIFKYFVNGDK